MSIIEKYLVKEFTKYFFIIISLISGIWIIFDFFDEIDTLIESGLGFAKAAFVFFAYIPFINFIPVAILLSILFTLGLMNRNNEILALQSSGISVYYLLRVIMIMGVLFSVFYFILSEQIMPIIKSKENQIWTEVKKKEDVVKHKKESAWIKSGEIITRVSHYNPRKQTAFGIALYYFDKEFNLIRRVDAKKGVYQEGVWVFHEVMDQTFDRTSGASEVSIRENIKERLEFKPQDLTSVVKKSEEMNLGELREYIEKIESEGYDATTYKVDLYLKTAQPFYCLIMCIVGTGVALNRKLRNSMPLIVLSGLGVIFLYYVFYSFCISIGYGGVISPFFAAWAPNFIFLCGGIVAVIYAE